MGLLRIYLALCVLANHSGPVFPWQMHDGRQAVQVFYLISGFYMAMVLSSSRYATARDFYTSRLLRIFPPYWITLLATFLVSLAAGLLFQKWLFLSAYTINPLSQNGIAGFLTATLSNVTLIGQDYIMFLSHPIDHSVHFTQNFWTDQNPLWRYLLVPQAWSIGVELTFYAFAPCLNRLRSRWLALIVLVSIAARLLAYRLLGSPHDPWTYRFFPFEIGLFLLGMLGHRLYLRTSAFHAAFPFRCLSNFSYFLGGAFLIIAFNIHVHAISGMGRYVGSEMAVLISYPFWMLAVPVLFYIYGNQKLDRLIGELSYPIYLIHHLIIALVSIFLRHFNADRWQGITSAFISVVIAIVFYRTIIAPLDKSRLSLTRPQLESQEPGGAGAKESGRFLTGEAGSAKSL